MIASPRGRAVLAILSLLAASSCGTIGVGVPSLRTDFGPRVELRVCLLVDRNVREERARELIAAAARELDPYAIDVVVSWLRPWERPGFFSNTMLAELLARPLEPPCDRLVAFAGWDLRDTIWGLVLPRTLGLVDGNTRTRAVIMAHVATPGQLLMSPASTTAHEFYHLLGCRHALTKRGCYTQIRAAKAARAAAADFFPGLTYYGEPIPTRREVDASLSD